MRSSAGLAEVREARRRELESLARRIREVRGQLVVPGVDPGDLDLILESLLRLQDGNRRFFLYPRPGGGFEF